MGTCTPCVYSSSFDSYCSTNMSLSGLWFGTRLLSSRNVDLTCKLVGEVSCSCQNDIGPAQHAAKNSKAEYESFGRRYSCRVQLVLKAHTNCRFLGEHAHGSMARQMLRYKTCTARNFRRKLFSMLMVFETARVVLKGLMCIFPLSLHDAVSALSALEALRLSRTQVCVSWT